MAGRIVRTIAVAACALLVLATLSAAQPTAGAGSMQLNVKDAPVQEVLKLIAESGDMNLAIGDGVKGRVTVFIEEMAPRDLLEVVVGIIGAAYVEENGVIWVMSKENYEAIYGEKFVDNLESRTFVLKQAKVKEIMPSIKALLGDKAIVSYFQIFLLQKIVEISCKSLFSFISFDIYHRNNMPYFLGRKRTHSFIVFIRDFN